MLCYTEQHITVDEYLSLWKGGLRFKVSIAIMRGQYCIKYYMLHEWSTTNLPDIIVQTGADTVYPEPSITLLQVLILENNTDVCRTLHKRRGLPTDF